MVALLAEGVDRNQPVAYRRPAVMWSPSSRRAWIEISLVSVTAWLLLVALLAEGVDRNPYRYTNLHMGFPSPSSRRAWIEITERGCYFMTVTSPSSRRAWIEIASAPATRALRRSPSSRRAWIEITAEALPASTSTVALLAEGVDRNYVSEITPEEITSRPPRGGRG